MMLWYALLLFPTSISEMQAQEWKAFQPYRVCVLKHVKKLARLRDDVRTLENMARSRCRRQHTLVSAEVALDEAGIAVDAYEPASNFAGYDPRTYLSVMEAKLSQEFAAAVAQKRAKAK